MSHDEVTSKLEILKLERNGVQVLLKKKRKNIRSSVRRRKNPEG